MRGGLLSAVLRLAGVGVCVVDSFPEFRRGRVRELVAESSQSQMPIDRFDELAVRSFHSSEQKPDGRRVARETLARSFKCAGLGERFQYVAA